MIPVGIPSFLNPFIIKQDTKKYTASQLTLKQQVFNSLAAGLYQHLNALKGRKS
jgi:hypothetical protein